ncbi:MAG: hypothetical protein ABWY78_10055, partial [Microvirga sp.]
MMATRWIVGAAALGLWAGAAQAGPLPAATVPAAGFDVAEPVQFFYGDPPQPRRGYAPPPADDGFYDPPPRRGYYPQQPSRGYNPPPPGYAPPQPRYGYRPEPMPAPGYPPGYYGGGS